MGKEHHDKSIALDLLDSDISGSDLYSSDCVVRLLIVGRGF